MHMRGTRTEKEVETCATNLVNKTMHKSTLSLGSNDAFLIAYFTSYQSWDSQSVW
jgi:hypothetical protein